MKRNTLALVAAAGVLTLGACGGSASSEGTATGEGSALPTPTEGGGGGASSTKGGSGGDDVLGPAVGSPKDILRTPELKGYWESCNGVSKDSVNGYRAVTMNCWNNEYGEQVFVAVFEKRNSEGAFCRPNSVFRACYMGSNWIMKTEGTEMMHEILPKNEDPAFILTKDDPMPTPTN